MPVVYDKSKEINISFRDIYPFRTTLGIFGLYRYPAKFIPQVIMYVLKEYGKPSDVVLDPFAGQGTVGFVCRLLGFDYEIWDLNPMLSFLHSFSTIKELPKSPVEALVKDLRVKRGIFLPEWSNLTYWYPEEFLETLGSIAYSISGLNEVEKKIFTMAFLRVARVFSYADEKVHKLYKSKKAIAKVKKMLSSNWNELIFGMMERETNNVIAKIGEYLQLKPHDVNSVVRAGVDSLTMELDRFVDILVTSPPYLQAQEYIRSTKLELYWLGYSEKEIKKLSKKEIPYRKDIPNFDVKSETFYQLEDVIPETLKGVYRAYFKAVISTLERLSFKTRKYMFVFVGPVHLSEVRVPIDRIIIEHFESLGWHWVHTLVDKVKGRTMFNTRDRKNPATGKQNPRMETEHLVVLKNMR